MLWKAIALINDDPINCQGPPFMMTSSNGNIFRVTGPLCGEFTSHRWIPHTKASDAELWLSGVPDYFGRNKISSGGDLSHYSSASLY